MPRLSLGEGGSAGKLDMNHTHSAKEKRVAGYITPIQASFVEKGEGNRTHCLHYLHPHRFRHEGLCGRQYSPSTV